MTLHRLVFAFALGGAALYGCGSDTTSDNSPANIPPVGAGKMDAGSSTTPPSSDAARPADAALVVDSGALRNDSGTAVDSGARDSGAAADSGKPQDSGTTAVDSGTSTSTADSGAPMMSSAGDPSSAKCLACEKAECVAAKWPTTDFTFKDCTEFGTETAKGGMATGMPRRQLCEQLLTCVRTTRCADPVVTVDAMGMANTRDGFRCLCGDQPFETCFGVKSIAEFKGQCRNQIADAAETTDVQTLLDHWTDPEFASGAAFNRVICQENLCSDECYAPCENKPNGTLCAGHEPLTTAPGSAGTCSMNKCVDDTMRFAPQ